MSDGKICFGDIEIDELDVQYNMFALKKRDRELVSVSTSTSNIGKFMEKRKGSDKQVNVLVILLVLVPVILFTFDVKEKVYSDSTDKLIEIQECTRLFTINRCLDKVPLTEQMCLKWEKCMAQDSRSYYFMQVFSSLFALLIQSFFENIQINTIGMFLISSIFVLYFIKKFN